MYAGAALSALGHAGLIALAVWAMPWMRAREAPPAPVIAARLVDPADLADAARRAAAAEPLPPVEPPPAEAPAPVVPPVVQGPRFVGPEPPEPEPEPVEPSPDEFTLAPSFDAASPLGIAPGEAPVAPDPEAVPDPEAAPEAEAVPDAGTEAEVEAEVPAPDPAVLRAAHMEALSKAVVRARTYPPAAKGRGLMGTARLYLEVGRDGRLMQAGLMSSSGSVSLDLAALDAAKRARFPAAPDDLPGASFTFLQDVFFEPR